MLTVLRYAGVRTEKITLNCNNTKLNTYKISKRANFISVKNCSIYN